MHSQVKVKKMGDDSRETAEEYVKLEQDCSASTNALLMSAEDVYSKVANIRNLLCFVGRRNSYALESIVVESEQE